MRNWLSRNPKFEIQDSKMIARCSRWVNFSQGPQLERLPEISRGLRSASRDNTPGWRLNGFYTALLFATFALTSCDRPSGNSSNAGADPQVMSLGTVEVTARLVEIPDGAIFQRDLYDYATILKYEVVSIQRGSIEKGSIIYVGHYNPWKPRAEAADKRAKNIGGTLRQFRAGQLHRMALETPLDDYFMGGVVDKYFGQHTGPAYWALWTNNAE